KGAKLFAVPSGLVGTATAVAPTLADFTNELDKGHAFIRGPRGTGDQQTGWFSDSKAPTSANTWLNAQKYASTSPASAKTPTFGKTAASFKQAADHLPYEYLTTTPPPARDPIFPSDPRYPAHIKKVP